MSQSSIHVHIFLFHLVKIPPDRWDFPAQAQPFYHDCHAWYWFGSLYLNLFALLGGFGAFV
jgi:quinol-cytochrome oxidoreductase complex cytochrome b subunit